MIQLLSAAHRLSLPVLLISCVVVNGVVFASTIRVPADQPTLQAEIDATAVGDTVLVAPGSYSGPGNRDLSLGGREITLLSELGPEHTTLELAGLLRYR